MAAEWQGVCGSGTNPGKMLHDLCLSERSCSGLTQRALALSLHAKAEATWNLRTFTCLYTCLGKGLKCKGKPEAAMIWSTPHTMEQHLHTEVFAAWLMNGLAPTGSIHLWHWNVSSLPKHQAMDQQALVRRCQCKLRSHDRVVLPAQNGSPSPNKNKAFLLTQNIDLGCVL